MKRDLVVAWPSLPDQIKNVIVMLIGPPESDRSEVGSMTWIAAIRRAPSPCKHQTSNGRMCGWSASLGQIGAGAYGGEIPGPLGVY
jgi:hypothetical protein